MKPINITLSRQEAKHLRHLLNAATKPISPKIRSLQAKLAEGLKKSTNDLPN